MKITTTMFPSSIRLSPELEKAAQGQKSELMKPTDGPSFSDIISEKIQQVDDLQKQADVKMTDVATGKSRNLHEAILSMEMADTSLKMLVTVRNKAIEAYQEMMRMPI